MEYQQWLKNMEELDRYLEGRSEADHEFFCVHGYLPDPPLPGTPVHVQARRSWKDWLEHKRMLAGRSKEECEFFCVYGYWPPQTKGDTNDEY